MRFLLLPITVPGSLAVLLAMRRGFVHREHLRDVGISAGFSTIHIRERLPGLGFHLVAPGICSTSKAQRSGETSHRKHYPLSGLRSRSVAVDRRSLKKA